MAHSSRGVGVSQTVTRNTVPRNGQPCCDVGVNMRLDDPVDDNDRDDDNNNDNDNENENENDDANGDNRTSISNQNHCITQLLITIIVKIRKIINNNFIVKVLL